MKSIKEFPKWNMLWQDHLQNRCPSIATEVS